MLLSFREDELQENCPCPMEIQQLLQDFHHLLNAHCGWNTVYLWVFYYFKCLKFGLIYKILNGSSLWLCVRSLSKFSLYIFQNIFFRRWYRTISPHFLWAINQIRWNSLSDDVSGCSSTALSKPTESCSALHSLNLIFFFVALKTTWWLVAIIRFSSWAAQCPLKDDW